MVRVGNLILNTQIQGPTFLKVLKEGLTGYIILGIIAAILLVYIVIPLFIWLFTLLRIKPLKLLVAFVGLLAYILDFVFILIVRIFRIKKLSTILDFNTDWLTIFADKKVNRHALKHRYMKQRKKTIPVFTLLFILFFSLADTYRAYEVSVIVERLYITIDKAKLYAEGLRGQSFDEKNQAMAVQNTAEVTVTYIKVNKEGNIRADGSINAEKVDVASEGELLEYLQEDMEDGKRIWYKVRTDKGKEGWISGNLSSKVEAAQTGR